MPEDHNDERLEFFYETGMVTYPLPIKCIRVAVVIFITAWVSVNE